MSKWFAQGVTSCKNQGFSSQRGVGSEDAAMASVSFSDPQREVASENVVMAFVYCFYNPRRELGPENMWRLLCASFLSLPLNIFKFVCLFIYFICWVLFPLPLLLSAPLSHLCWRPPIYSSSVSVQEGAGLPRVSTKCDTSSCSKTKHLHIV